MARPAAERLSLKGFAAVLPGSRFDLIEQFLAPEQAKALMQRLLAELSWQQHRVKLFGREIPAPRLSCWVGDAGADYRYSGVHYPPNRWTEALLAARAELEQHCQQPFNSVLANWYRNGADSMGWHSDDEAQLGPQPLIASLSLGAERRFQLRSRDQRWRCDLQLSHGSLLLMGGTAQRLSQHALPKLAKRAQACGPRLNLTFRQIVATQPSKPS